MNLTYLSEKISKAEFLREPFSHIYIEDFFDEEDFQNIINNSHIKISCDTSSDLALINKLEENDWKSIEFPGCTTKKSRYIKERKNKSVNNRESSVTEGRGMVFRSYSNSQVITNLREYFGSEEFLELVTKKFKINKENVKYDGGVQKYLDGYEISPHPDIRRKALTFMININPGTIAAGEDYHTHYMKLNENKSWLMSMWKSETRMERFWVPWHWATTSKKQFRNNSIVIFSPSFDTIHAVKASYDHFAHQRTQIYGNLWYKDSEALTNVDWDYFNFQNTKSKSEKFNGLLGSLVKKIYNIGDRNI